MTEAGGGRVRGTARAEVEARLLDLSLGGALLGLGAELRIGSIHDFRLDLRGEPFRVQGEVRRCEGAPGEYRVGVAFVGIHPHDEKRQRDYLESSR